MINRSNVVSMQRDMEITVEVRNVYGEERIYPICRQAELLAALAGTKTITWHAVDVIKALGFKINVKQKVYTI